MGRSTTLEIQDFIGDWRDTFGHDVWVGWSRPGNRGGQLDVQLRKPGRNRDPIKLNVKDLGNGRFACGHYDLDIGESHRGKIVWLDHRNPGRRSIWNREDGGQQSSWSQNEWKEDRRGDWKDDRHGGWKDDRHNEWKDDRRGDWANDRRGNWNDDRRDDWKDDRRAEWKDDRGGGYGETNQGGRNDDWREDRHEDAGRARRRGGESRSRSRQGRGHSNRDQGHGESGAVDPRGRSRSRSRSRGADGNETVGEDTAGAAPSTPPPPKAPPPPMHPPGPSSGPPPFAHPSAPPPVGWGGYPPPFGYWPGHPPPYGAWDPRRPPAYPRQADGASSVWSTAAPTPGAWVPPTAPQPDIPPEVRLSQAATTGLPAGGPPPGPHTGFTWQTPPVSGASDRPRDPRVRPSDVDLGDSIPPATLALADAPANGVDGPSWRTLITGMYRRFNPDKLKELNTILDKYKGEEADLYQALCDKYLHNARPRDPRRQRDGEDSEEDSLQEDTLEPPSFPVPQVIEVGALKVEDEDFGN